MSFIKEEKSWDYQTMNWHFIDAISSNESARDFYENDVLKQIAKELTISIKNNIKVDWDVPRESVRHQSPITVKRLLRKY